MAVTCLIQYEIDPFQRDNYIAYADNWSRIIPRCGGGLMGYFAPYEGTNNMAYGLVSFDSLADYESYRQRLKSDPEGARNYAFARDNRFILREQRSFLAPVASTLRAPRATA